MLARIENIKIRSKVNCCNYFSNDQPLNESLAFRNYPHLLASKPGFRGFAPTPPGLLHCLERKISIEPIKPFGGGLRDATVPQRGVWGEAPQVWFSKSDNFSTMRMNQPCPTPRTRVIPVSRLNLLLYPIWITADMGKDK
jgi:hypothetical protein